MQRNEDMVNNSDRVLAMYSQDEALNNKLTTGGTAECVKYAKSIKKPVDKCVYHIDNNQLILGWVGYNIIKENLFMKHITAHIQLNNDNRYVDLEEYRITRDCAILTTTTGKTIITSISNVIIDVEETKDKV